MLYLLLIVPHLLITAGLLAYAYSTKVAGCEDDADGPAGGASPAASSGTPPPQGGLPLPDAATPRRHLRVHERLRDLYPRRLRGEHPPERPQRTVGR